MASLGLTIKLINKKEIIRLLELIPKEADKVLVRAFTRGVRPIQKAAESKAPRRKTGRGGTLAQSMTTSVNKKPGDIAVFMGPGKEGFYGQFQELGTARHGAQPFMRPAFDENKSLAAKIIGKIIGATVKLAAKKALGGAAR